MVFHSADISSQKGVEKVGEQDEEVDQEKWISWFSVRWIVAGGEIHILR